MVWVNNIDIDTFYPKCFDLNDDDDYAHFQEYFKICKAQSILLLYLKLYTNK
jgi:tubulin monoglycylase TTLL3/8